MRAEGFADEEASIRDSRESLRSVVVKGIAVSGIGNIAMRLLDVVIAVLMLRWLSIYEFGVYRLAIAAYDVGAGLFLAGVENVVVSDVSRDLNRDLRRAKSAFSVYFYFMVLVGVALWALFFLGARQFSLWFGVESFYLKIVSFLFLIAPIETAYKLKFQIFLDFVWSTAFRSLRDIIRLGAIAGAWFFFSFNLTAALYSLIAAVIGPVIVAWFWYRRGNLYIIPTIQEFKRAGSALFLSHGKWALLDDLLNNWGQNIRPFILRAFAGAEAVALLAVAQNLTAYAKSLFPIREVLLPVMPRSADQPDVLAVQLNQATKYATWGYLAAGAASALFAPILVSFFFPKYFPALPFFYLLLAGLPFFGFRSVALPVFFAMKAQDVLFKISATRVVALAVLNLVLTYFFGIWGAATEMLLIGIFTMPAYAAGIRRILPRWNFRWRDVFVFDHRDKTVIAEIFSQVRKKWDGAARHVRRVVKTRRAARRLQ